MRSSERSGVRQYHRSEAPRLRWTEELHRRFVEVVDFLGGERKATPKRILQMMDVTGLSISHIKSHLQDYQGPFTKLYWWRSCKSFSIRYPYFFGFKKFNLMYRSPSNNSTSFHVFLSGKGTPLTGHKTSETCSSQNYYQNDQTVQEREAACDLTLSTLNYELVMERRSQETHEWSSSIEELDGCKESNGSEDHQVIEKKEVIDLELTI